eukprot:349680-Chlamydomonas_euryale.AAC.1
MAWRGQAQGVHGGVLAWAARARPAAYGCVAGAAVQGVEHPQHIVHTRRGSSRCGRYAEDGYRRGWRCCSRCGRYAEDGYRHGALRAQRSAAHPRVLRSAEFGAAGWHTGCAKLWRRLARLHTHMCRLLCGTTRPTRPVVWYDQADAACCVVRPGRRGLLCGTTRPTRPVVWYDQADAACCVVRPGRRGPSGTHSLQKATLAQPMRACKATTLIPAPPPALTSAPVPHPGPIPTHAMPPTAAA